MTIKRPSYRDRPKRKHHLSRLIAGTALAVLAFSALAAEPTDNPADNVIGRFEITRFQVEGNTLLPAATVDSLLVPFAGKNRDFGDVQRALETLEAEYHKRGFNVVQVALPEQELNQGVVRFQVIETKIGKVTVEGNTFFSEANIRHSLPALREGETPNIAHVSASIKVANDNPAKKTSLHLQSGEKDDEVNAVLKVTDEKAWKLGLNLDNTGNKSTGNSHVSVQLQHLNVADLDHVLSVQYSTTLEKPSRVSVYGVGYHVPLYTLADSMDFFGSYSDVDSGSVTAGIFDLQVSGRGSVFGARYNHSLDRIGDYDSKLIFGLDYKAFQNNVSLQGVQLGNDVTVHPLSLTYSGTLALPTGEAGFYLTAVHNLPGGTRGGVADFNRVRSGARADYNILRYGANYSRALPQEWQMRVTFSGQYASDSLIPGEQFGAGGASSVRGFTEREISNDVGHLLSTELYTPNFCAGIEAVATQCRMLAFYDSAYASRNNPLAGEQLKASISSVGLGLRFSMSKYLNLQMDYGQVVDAGGAQNKGDKRLHFMLGLSY